MTTLVALADADRKLVCQQVDRCCESVFAG